MSKHAKSKTFQPSRRKVLKFAGIAAGTALAAPFAPYVRRARAEPLEINMLSWYGLAEPDMVEAFEAEHNVKFKPKYYAGGDNMLAALAQSPPGTFDIIHADAEFARILIGTRRCGRRVESRRLPLRRHAPMTSFTQVSRPLEGREALLQ